MPEIEMYELQGILIKAVELGNTQFAVKHGVVPATIPLSQAHSLYGKRTIDRWLKEKLIQPIQDGAYSNIRIDLIKLTQVALTSNRTTYLGTHER